jgi:hypothetical protein
MKKITLFCLGLMACYQMAFATLYVGSFQGLDVSGTGITNPAGLTIDQRATKAATNAVGFLTPNRYDTNSDAAAAALVNTQSTATAAGVVGSLYATNSFVYVSYKTGNDSWTGTRQYPNATIGQGLTNAFNSGRNLWVLDCYDTSEAIQMQNFQNSLGLTPSITFDDGCVVTNLGGFNCEGVTNLNIYGHLAVYDKFIQVGEGPAYYVFNIKLASTTNLAGTTLIGDSARWVTNYLDCTINADQYIRGDEDIDPATPGQKCVSLKLHAAQDITWWNSIGFTLVAAKTNTFTTEFWADNVYAKGWNRGGTMIIHGGNWSKISGTIGLNGQQTYFQGTILTNMSSFPGTGTNTSSGGQGAYGWWNVNGTNYAASINGPTNTW